jgi:hypothetical protein
VYIVVTEVDYSTGIPCTVEPQRTGPTMPAIKGLSIVWTDQSTWPVSLDRKGVYLRAPKYYGICDDDADTSLPGVLEVLTEAEWNSRRVAEHEARRPFPSWVGCLDTMSWEPPIPRPADDIHLPGGLVAYNWDEATLSWVLYPQPT